MHLEQFLSIAAGIIGALTFVGAVVRGQSKDTNIKTLESGNAELRAQVSDLRQENVQLVAKVKVAQDAADAAELLKKNAIDMAQSRPAFEKLGVQMVTQHKQLMGELGKLIKAIGKGNQNG